MSLSESGPAGYALDKVECSVKGGDPVSGAEITLEGLDTAVCTFTNNDDQPGHLTLAKTVTNNNGGTTVPTVWTLAAKGPTPISGTTGSASVTNAPIAAGSYNLSEAGPAG